MDRGCEQGGGGMVDNGRDRAHDYRVLHRKQTSRTND